MQVLHNGSAPASQAGCVGSIPITCSSSSQATYGLRRFLLHKIRLRLLRCSSLSSANASLVCVRIKGQKDIAEKLGDVFFGIQGMLSGNRFAGFPSTVGLRPAGRISRPHCDAARGSSCICRAHVAANTYFIALRQNTGVRV